MVEVSLKLPDEAKKKVLEVLEEELAKLESRASQLRKELKIYEEKYGLSSRELIRLWDDAVKCKKSLPLPEDADLDFVEWRALYELYKSLLKDIEELQESVRRLCEA